MTAIKQLAFDRKIEKRENSEETILAVFASWLEQQVFRIYWKVSKKRFFFEHGLYKLPLTEIRKQKKTRKTSKKNVFSNTSQKQKNNFQSINFLPFYSISD